MMKKLHRNRYKNVVVAMMMVFFMFVGMGTTQVHAAETDQTNLPDPLPTTTKDGYDFAGWYTDADFVTVAQPGQAITADTTLYAKWVEHSHIFKDAWSSNDTSHWHEAACEHTIEKRMKLLMFMGQQVQKDIPVPSAAM